MYFPLNEYFHIYIGFVVFVLFLVFLDLGIISKAKKHLTTKQALQWSVGWISLGIITGVVIWKYAVAKHGVEVGNRLGLEYFSGFLIEKALAVDNIFVFVLIFSSLGVHRDLQHRVLSYGILGALFFRAVFISLGAALVQYKFMLYVFGAFLIITGIKMIMPSKKEAKLEDGKLYQFLHRHLPLTPQYFGGQFWIRQGGRLLFTPLFLALLLIEISDIIFAIDSVPAIFAITKEPFLVFTSNMMAILGLRSLYLVLADAVHRFEYLKYGLAFVLVFVGLKMVWLNDLFGGHFPIGISLGIIGLALVASIVVSLKKTKGQDAPEPLM